MVAFTLVAGWSLIALRTAAQEGELLRSGYLPLSLALRDAVADQDAWNTQLNHVTTAANPADKRVWFDAALAAGRPRTFAKLRAAIHRAFQGGERDPSAELARELTQETADILELGSADGQSVAQLFEALARGDAKLAEQRRAELVTRGARIKGRLGQLEQRVQARVDALAGAAQRREAHAFRLLVALLMVTSLVALGSALRVRRVLAPLARVTARARAVARGELEVQPVLETADELGELAATFERMVAAIAAANEQLLAADRLATIGKMAAHVTHEIRNPLSSIALNVEMLEEELAESPERSEARALLQAIQHEIERLTALSEQYLSMARQQPPNLQEEDLAEVVREACDFMRLELKRHDVRLSLEVEPDLPLVALDEAQLRQVCFNLLRNARESMPEGGLIEVSVRRRGAAELVVCIADEGVGFDAQDASQLFEPFFTTKGQGTGLGLAISRQVLEAHGGGIECHARTPRGTEFCLSLPITAAGARPRAVTRGSDRPHLASGGGQTT